jgi:hypothetical protein
MIKIRNFAVLVCLLAAANAWGAYFGDDFNRANGPVGNGWEILLDGTIKVEIIDNEVLIAGTESATAWNRAGISRTVSGGVKKVSFDFLADDVFNVHLRVEAEGSPAWLEVYAWAGGPFSYANSTTGAWPAGPWTAIAGSGMVAGEYNTLMLEFEDGVFTLTLNGTVVGTIANAAFTSVGWVQFASDADANQSGSLHIDNVQIGVLVPGTPKEPSPPPGATDVPRDVTLGWTAGKYADTHNVYLGTSFEDVNNASVAQAVGKSLMNAAFQPESLLEYGRTYFWRVDEVNAPPSSTVYKGDIWSFTTEPYVYQVTNIQATASSSFKGTDPQNTVNGSGLSNGAHSTASADMWVSNIGAPEPAWIQFEFDRAYKLQDMLVWNSNTEYEQVLGYGFKDVTIESSLNGTDWMLVMETQFPQATADSSYAPTEAISLNGAYAKFLRFTAQSNWSLMGVKQWGLSEVQFFQIPVVARAPQPADGAQGVVLEPTLIWRPGRETVSQQVYFDTDRQAVADGTAASAGPSGNSYQPGSLDYGQLYYWRVDEVNDAATPGTWQGDVWSFTTTDFFVVDDFESYNDEEDQGTRIYENWIDGYSDGSSGSMVGNLNPPFAERTIVHGGSQSMPMDYNNVVAPYYSEAVREFSPTQDWTVKGVTDLILWVQGNQVAMAPVTETGGTMTVTGEGSDIWNASDQFTFAYKTLSGDGVITARVTSNGTGSNSWAKGGVMIRDSLEAGSAFAMMVLTGGSDGGNGAAFQNRASTDLDMSANDASSNTNSPTVIAPPYYVKIERKTDSISGSVSPDGTNWTQMGTTKYIAMTAPAYIGLCVTAGAPGENRTYTFDTIKATGATGSWQTKEVGLARNSPQDLYVTVEDSSGKKATATNAELVTTAEWTEWRIPLSSLTGVNLTKVKKLYVGVGDKTNPQPDGAGKIYIDDIRVGCPSPAAPDTGGL